MKIRRWWSYTASQGYAIGISVYIVGSRPKTSVIYTTRAELAQAQYLRVEQRLKKLHAEDRNE